MRITPPTATPMPTTAPTAPVPRASAPATPAPLDAPDGSYDTPAFLLYKQVGTDVLRMPGVRSMRIWGSSRPNELGIVAADERAAAAIVGVLEPKIGDVEFRVYVGSSQEPYAGPEGRLSDRIGIVDALTGVWGHKANIMRRGSGTVTFWTIDQRVVDRLDPLLRNRYDLGYDANGWKVYVNVRWKPGVPA